MRKLQVRVLPPQLASRRPIADPVPRAGAEPRRAVAGIRELTSLERQTSASDALCEPGSQTFQLSNALIDSRGPRFRESRPILPGGRSMGRQFRQLCSDLIECQTDSLRENDESDPTQNRPGITPLSAAGPLGRDESALLVEAERRGCDPAPPRHFTDKKQVTHAEESSAIRP